MTSMAQNSELMLFITHVETDGPLLKIWGQIDRNAATCVERMILPLSEKFAQGLGLPNPSLPVPLNAVCCARFQNEGYYRAKICSVQPGGNVLVHFIDYGNFEILPPSAIRLLESIPGTVSLLALPPLALDFVLANILPANGIWEIETIESIKQTLRYADLKGMLHSVIGSNRLLKLCYNNEDFGDLLVSKKLGVNVTLQEMFSARRTPPNHRPLIPPPPPQQQQQQFSSHVNLNSNHARGENGAQNQAGSSPYSLRNNHQQQNPNLNTPSTVHQNWRNPSPPQKIPQIVQEALVFKSRVLDVGSVHQVFVSYVEDGPLKFAVQVQSTSQILKQLMNEINNYPTSPLQEPPLPGSVCLGRYSLDKVLCRAVVMSVMEHKCKLYYVDFGHTEVLPYSDIFQLPPQYINPRVLSIRFTLSGLKDMVITDSTKEYFKKIVTGKPLVLQVRPPEGPPLIQYGDLYDNGTNIRDVIRENCSTTVQTFFQEPLRLKRGAKELVHVSFVESCSKFFVQLDTGIESLDSIMACLAEYANEAPQLEENFIRIGSPCCACYGEDKQWYRAQILNVKGDQVTVLYIDYGNEETVSASALRKIHNTLVTNLRAQAIKCCLNGYQSSIFSQEMANQFELLVLEKQLAMEVVDALPNGTVVQLFDCSVVPMINVASQLQISNAQTKGAANPNLNSSNNSQRDGEPISRLNSSRSPDSKYQTEDRNTKWGKTASKPNTWGHDSRSSDSNWNTKSRSNNHDGKDHHFEERSRTKNVKEVENEQRQRENNRYEDQEDRLHQKETRNNHFNRNTEYPGGNRHERNEESGGGGSGSRRGTARGGNSRFGSSARPSKEENSNRFDKNTNKDDSWSDRDSDTSSRGSGKRGTKGPRGIKGRLDRGDRGGRRTGERKNSSGKWSDGDSDRSSQKSSHGSGFRSRDRNSSNSSWKQAKTQPSKTGTWNSMSPTSPVKELPRGEKLRIPPPNITVGAIKTVELTYVDSPTDFYVQLSPDNLELDKLMEKISQKYSNDGGTIMKKSEIRSGVSCVAQYSCDLKWYRAVIKSKNSDSNNVEVHFIDYGNSETIEHDKVKELLPEFSKLSSQAIHCRLFAADKSEWSDQEIAQFSQSSEGISLEAEFVDEENGVFDVLVKPADQNEHINKIFCGNRDLIQAKNDLKNKKKHSFHNNSVKKTQFIKSGEKWSDETFPKDYQIDVVVTWFVNPNNFYCQILNKQSEFRTMMNNIQEFYVDQQPMRNNLQIGEPVIAFFSDDGALYRAEIRELNKLRGHIVQYIDFGNCAMVDQRKIYPVEKRFTILPKQAMHCSLKDVSPAAGVDWSNTNKRDIDKYFDADKYKCIFHGTKDGKYLISLNDNGKDIGEAMINAHLAVNPELMIQKNVVDQQSAAELNQTSNNLGTQDPMIWNGQIIKTVIKNVQGIEKFFISLPESDNTQNQLIECYILDTNPSPEINEAFKKSVEGKEAIVVIKKVNNQRFAVEIYDALGKKVRLIDSGEEEGGKISPICPTTISNPVSKVWVTHIKDSENIWLQRSSDLDNIAELLSSLYEHYSESGSPLVPETGKLCAAESQDNNWYRGIIETVNPETESAEIRFIDYGNTEEVSFANLKTLEEKFYVPNKMGIQVSLIVKLKEEGGNKEDQNKILHEILDDKELTANFYNVDDTKWLVELSDPEDKKLSDKLKELNLVEEYKDLKPKREEEMIVGNKYKVFLSHLDTPAQFWLQRNEEIDAIESMQSSLQIEALNFSPVDGIPEEGTLCAALYSADGMWYRAEVLDADEDITTVRFIDYGNTDVVDSNSKNIRELPESWKSIKKFGVKSRLDLIPTGSEDWSAASCEIFEKMATASSSPITALIIADSFPRRVELFVGENSSVGDHLVKEGHAVMVHNAEDLIDELIELELDPRSAFVSHVNSPGEFWVQEEKSVSDLEIMSDRFMVAEMFPKLEGDIPEGKLCVAKFPDDEQWYRARVDSHTSTGSRVLYIDYGNSSTSIEVREIPEDLAAIPPLSRKCSLQLSSGVKEWSEEACDRFIDLAADGATIFLLDVIKDGETSVVNLTLDGINVADELLKLCDKLPVIDERLPPLGEENSPNIVVSHVNSPSEFWTQAESSMGELEIMASRLADAESLLPLNIFNVGTICAAKFPDDGEWYRAKILNHGDEGTDVLYFDYGNSALTTELRILPEDVANIPPLADKCTLKLPQDVLSWSQQARDKFDEIVADGATMFQFEILDDNDPILINLQVEGKDVVDILKPLCENKVLSKESNEQIIETLTSEIVEKVSEEQTESEIKETEVTGEIGEAKETKNAEKIDIGASDVPKTQNEEIETAEQIQKANLDVPEIEKPEINESEDLSVPEIEREIGNGDQPGENQAPKVQIIASETSGEITTDILDIPGGERVEITKEAEIEGAILSIKEEIDTENLETLEETEPEAVVSDIGEPVPPNLKTEIEDLGQENPPDLAKLSLKGEKDSEISSGLDKEGLEMKTETESSLTELTVDDIVGNMVKIALVESGGEEGRAEAEIGIEKEEEKVEIEMNKEVENIVGEIEKVKESSINEEMKEDSSINTQRKTPIMEKIVPGSISRGSMEEDIPLPILSRRRSSCTEDKIVPGGINKGNDLTTEADKDEDVIDLTIDDDKKVVEGEISNVLEDNVNEKKDENLEKERNKEGCENGISTIAVPVTPGKIQREEKIVPGSISRGESPTVELINRPNTPKTPHSEKILAGVVNLQENFEEDDDEIIIVEVESNNIPDNNVVVLDDKKST